MGRLLNRKKEDSFLDIFVQGSSIAHEAALCFQKAWKDHRLDHEELKQLKEIEHKGDKLVHSSLNKIEQAFITPIDRGDMLNLMYSIENITDSIDELSNHCYMMDFCEGNEHLEQLVRILVKATEELAELLKDFVDFKKKRKEIDAHIVEINHLEEEADHIYVEAIRELYKNPPAPIDLIRTQKIYELFEKCIDCTEDAADFVSTILISSN